MKFSKFSRVVQPVHSVSGLVMMLQVEEKGQQRPISKRELRKLFSFVTEWKIGVEVVKLSIQLSSPSLESFSLEVMPWKYKAVRDKQCNMCFKLTAGESAIRIHRNYTVCVTCKREMDSSSIRPVTPQVFCIPPALHEFGLLEETFMEKCSDPLQSHIYASELRDYMEEIAGMVWAK